MKPRTVIIGVVAVVVVAYGALLLPSACLIALSRGTIGRRGGQAV